MSVIVLPAISYGNTLLTLLSVGSPPIADFRGHCNMTQRTRGDLPTKGSWINQDATVRRLTERRTALRARRPRGHSVARFVVLIDQRDGDAGKRILWYVCVRAKGIRHPCDIFL
jgi:hypothetical protein